MNETKKCKFCPKVVVLLFLYMTKINSTVFCLMTNWEKGFNHMILTHKNSQAHTEYRDPV